MESNLPEVVPVCYSGLPVGHRFDHALSNGCHRINAMKISPTLLPVFWCAIGVMGVAALVMAVSLNRLLGIQRPALLRVVWISGSVLVAAAAALVIILFHR